MVSELPTLLGRRIIGWDTDGDDAEEITLMLDDGRHIVFWAAERCGDNPVVGFNFRESTGPCCDE